MIIINLASENGCNTRDQLAANSPSSGSEAGFGWRALMERPQTLIAPTIDFAHEAVFPGG